MFVMIEQGKPMNSEAETGLCGSFCFRPEKISCFRDWLSFAKLQAPALRHITPPKGTSLHGHGDLRKAHHVKKRHITSTQSQWPRPDQ